MQVMVHKWRNLDDATRTHLLSRSEQGIEVLADAVADIVQAVRTRGDEALRDFTARFDRVELGDLPLRVTRDEIEEGVGIVPDDVRSAIDYAVENVRRTHERQRPPAFQMEETRPGIHSGERAIPLRSVGLYVPRGRGSFPSMLYMLAVPARIAGVDRVAVATPPDQRGKIDPACLYAASICGVEEIYRVGGAQAVAAFAYGTESIPRVDKIIGPGSAYVAAAKRVVRDVVDVGLPAGPSESMIVADSSADAMTVSRDLLIEAEHGADSQALLVTTDPELAARVAADLPGLIGDTPEPRRGFLTAVFREYGGVIVATDLVEAASIVNEFAPEHLQLRLADPKPFVDQVRNAGEILIGRHTPFSLANYAIGPNAVLPTGGGARVHSGVSVNDFQKRVAVMEITAEGYAEIAPSCHPTRGLRRLLLACSGPERSGREPSRRRTAVNRWTSVDDVFSYLESFLNLERGSFNPREYRLERMDRLLREFGEPHRAYPVIHVAGSKGKGSVCTFAAHCCAAAGARVGVYMSPHVSDYRERITLLGQGTSEAQRDAHLLSCGEHIARYVDHLRAEEREETLPTTFELLTLLAFLVFREAECTMAVVEVGLGGRLDATNLVAPTVTVITRIELEHTDYLGDTLASVAREKGGIIKSGIPLILADQEEEVREVLRDIATERAAPLVIAQNAVDIQTCVTTDSGTDVSFRFADGLQVRTKLKLLGAIQASNAATAALAVRRAMPETTGDTLSTGLAEAWLPGRAELWHGDPSILLDGAHTPESIQTVMQIVRDLEPDARRRVLVYGSVKGKQHGTMLQILLDHFSEIIISRPGRFKESDTVELVESCKSLGGNCRRIDEMSEALAAARSATDGLVVVTGSFHLIGETRRILEAEGRRI